VNLEDAKSNHLRAYGEVDANLKATLDPALATLAESVSRLAHLIHE